jgi:hypothetical protein
MRYEWGIRHGNKLNPETGKEVPIVELVCSKSFSGGKIDGKNYWVTSVDSNEYEGLYLVQVKLDNRVTK